MSNKRFTKTYLHDLCKQYSINLLREYDEKELNYRTIIDFNCTICHDNTSKQFINIEKFNTFCKNCSYFTSKNRIKFDINFLNKLCKEKSIITTKDYSLESLNSLTQIEFNCIDCNNTVSKRFQYIQKYDAKCNNCSNKYGKCKANKTILSKYGVENISQIEEVKNRKKETTLKNYGVEHPLQNKDLMEKTFKNSYNIKTFKFE
jgi:3-methyladenine DNA glycosylase AlkC